MDSIWTQDISLPKFSKLTHDITTDVLVIGGGIAGILTAYCLNKKGVDCVLVEKDRILGGTTGNTTAKITYQHGLIYNKLMKSHGIEGAEMYYKANRLAFEKLSELCGQIDCDFEYNDNYVYSVNDRKALENEALALQRIGVNAVINDRPNIPVKTVGALKFSRQAQFHPLKFLSSIVGEINIFENTKVTELIGTIAKVENLRIKAEKIVVATHFPFLNKHGSFFLKLYQHRSYVIALKNAVDVEGMYVDESKTGLSFRNYKDILLLGGGGHRTGKQGGNWAELRRFAKSTFPNAVEVGFWAAQDCMSLDSVPYIGQYSKNTPNLYVATGFNKWGMTSSMLSGMLVSEMISNETPDYAEVFNPSRSILKPQLFVNGFESVTNLITPAKKRCPHLGCALKWNKAEHSWDCACHGSRFSENGKVLNNPATDDLPK